MISDFSTFAGLRLAKALRCPSIVNVPGPLDLMRLSGVMPYSTCWQKLLFACLPLRHTLPVGCRTLLRHLGREHALWLVNSVMGVEEEGTLPPSIVLTGPLKPHREEQLDPALQQWLTAQSSVVYVTMGSIARLTSAQACVSSTTQGLTLTGLAAGAGTGRGFEKESDCCVVVTAKRAAAVVARKLQKCLLGAHMAPTGRHLEAASDSCMCLPLRMGWHFGLS